jgi:putative ABC transport system permease protein
MTHGLGPEIAYEPEMNLWASICIALNSLKTNKLRSGLTMLGIIIGISSVITLVSVGQGMQRVVRQQIQGIGSNLVFVLPGKLSDQQSSDQYGFLRTVTTSSLTWGDANAIADPYNVPDVVGVAPEFIGSAKITYGARHVTTSISGVTPEYQSVRNFRAAYGTFVTTDDVRASARVAVLGQTVLRKLFSSDTDPLGESISINEVPFRVVGVMESKGGSGFGDADDVVFIPLTTAHTRLFSARSASGDYTVSIIYAATASEKQIPAARQQVTELLRQRHKIVFGTDEDDFTIITQADVQSALITLTNAITLFLGTVSAISLLVGGIGIMNIMLVSVTERTREIGIRKAVGAKRRDILVQFLIEAVVLSLIGGGIGIGLGMLGSDAVGRLSADLAPYVSLDTIAIATSFSIVVGIFFGLYPAIRAAQLNPIEALRYE